MVYGIQYPVFQSQYGTWSLNPFRVHLVLQDQAPCPQLEAPATGERPARRRVHGCTVVPLTKATQDGPYIHTNTCLYVYVCVPIYIQIRCTYVFRI